jgi:UV DNA damage endonuclease
MVRLGLCCSFLEEPIKFRTTTARYASTLTERDRVTFYNELAHHNARSLLDAIAWCSANGIGAFRINSGVLPMFTHPEVGWSLAGEAANGVADVLRAAAVKRRDLDVRLSFHPDQFVVLGSTKASVVAASIAELEYMAQVAHLVGAEQMTVHGGGAQGGKADSLERLAAGVAQLSPLARSLLVLENDDRVYTVENLLPVCEKLGLPLVYDVHHHRCNPDRLGVEQATELAAATWGDREPWAHLSSPALGWREGDPRPHADFIATRDVPSYWLGRRLTVDVEAKAKEVAVLRLRRWLATRDKPATRAGTRAARGLQPR